MLKNTPIEETFHKAFDNFEADVNVKVWTNIEQHISSTVAPQAGKALSEAGKGIFTAGKFSVLTYGIASSVIIAIVAASYFYLIPSKSESSSIKAEKTEQLKPTSHTNISSPIIDITAETKHENNLNSQSPVENQIIKHEQKAISKDATIVEKQEVLNDVKATNSDNTGSLKNGAQELNTIDKDSPENVNTENNNQSFAGEKHETTPVEDISNPNVLPLEKPSENDSFDWGVIANSFSPNNDGKNDAFVIKTPDLKTLEVTIYDPKNGKVIYVWKNLEGSWDGKDLNGKEMPAGFYLYSIFAQSIDGKPHSKKGTLYIFR